MKIKTTSDKKYIDTKKTSKKNFWSNFRRYLKQYTESSGIHGISYLSENRSVFEKVIWAIIFLISLGGFWFMVYQIVQKYQTSPVILVFATTDTPLFEIPFPAITVCPESKCLETVFNYSRAYSRRSEIVNDTEFRYLYYVSMFCNMDEHFWLRQYNISIEDDFFEISLNLKPSEIVSCYYMGESCMNHMTPVITDRGICYSFNIIDKKDMFRDDVYYHKNLQNVTTRPLTYRNDGGYRDKAEIYTYPKRALMAGADNSLILDFVHVWYTSDLVCNKYQQGHKVLIHNPLEFPRLSKSYFSVPLEQTVVAVAQPHLISTSDEVRAFSPERRNCYSENERSLHYFKYYTQSNCLLECETNYTLNQCGCVNYYMPRKNGTKICDGRDYDCILNVSRTLKITSLENKISGAEGTVECDCKLSCTSLQYNVETSNSDNYLKEYFVFQNTTEILDIDNHTYSVLTVYFNSDQFIAIERNELYGTSDLIANFGGLLGLFTGFSLISGAEIIYFFTLRIIYNIKLYGRWFASTSNA